MKYKVLVEFFDKQAKKIHKVDNILEIDEKRAKEINEKLQKKHGLIVEKIEETEEKGETEESEEGKKKKKSSK